MAVKLKDYNKKRNFKITSEPQGKIGKNKGKKLVFCVQKHDATRLHYDFRLELDGVLKSWAVTKGPSFNPQDKRLAVHVEDHPYDYRTFEGVIPEGQYGGGPVMLWDEGTWEPVNDPHEGMKKGHLTFMLYGHRMNGEWALIRMKGRPGEKRDNWLLVKADKDEFVQTEEQSTLYLDENNTSVKTGRTMEEINGGKAKQRGKAKKVPPKPSAATKEKSVISRKSLDALGKSYPEVQLATLVEHPPMGKDWWHEIKYDGYRILALIDNGNVRIRTRGGLDWTEKFQGIADELAQLKIKSAVLDGEAVVLDEKGASNFSKLKEALSENNQADIHAFFFDLLHLDGKDYHTKPLSERKPVLDKLLNKQAKLTHLHISEHLDDSENLLPMVCKLGAEGIVSKRVDASYKFKRSKDWLKSKCGQEQEFVIGGFMPSSEDSKAIGSLHLGFYRNGKLSYAGKVGTGYTRKLAKELYNLLKPLQRKTMPFTDNMPKGERNAVWVEPEQIGQVAFWEWTPDRHIRHASFKGLREDKTPKQVTREKAKKTPHKKSKKIRAADNKQGELTLDNVTISHPGRIMFPDVKITKGQVAQYYHDAMDYVLPFLEKRPVSVIRFPGDINGEAFFQRNPMKGVSADVQPVTFDYKDVKRTYFYIDTPEGLMSLVQMGTIEFHPWGVHVKDVHHPDQIIFDLDPAPDVPFDAVKLAALDMRQRLKKMKLESFVRTTGGKGLHVTVPIKPNVPWADAKEWAREFCERMVEDVPDAYVATMTKAKRGGKIFLDFFRNDYTATAVSPFVIRGRKGAPMAMPVEWKELDNLKSASQFTIKNARERMNARTRKLIEAQLNCNQKLPV